MGHWEGEIGEWSHSYVCMVSILFLVDSVFIRLKRSVREFTNFKVTASESRC